MSNQQNDKELERAFEEFEDIQMELGLFLNRLIDNADVDKYMIIRMATLELRDFINKFKKYE